MLPLLLSLAAPNPNCNLILVYVGLRLEVEATIEGGLEYWVLIIDLGLRERHEQRDWGGVAEDGIFFKF